MKIKEMLFNKRGQTAVEYIVTAAGLFTAIISFYVLYSHLVPQQFDQGAKVILSEYDTGS
ncbi:MAG: hypothetical protein ACI351_00250 [Candidatus Avelusimicrobium sp.]|uniref:hypothetical protein n=1 Tax=Candidatus Avelusimicrobium sp. TaxID=3048833 RepID=UPI003F0BF20C